QAVVHTHPFYAATLGASGARFEKVSQDSLQFAEGLGVCPTAEPVMTVGQGKAVATPQGGGRGRPIKDTGVTLVRDSAEPRGRWRARRWSEAAACSSRRPRWGRWSSSRLTR